MKIVFIRHGKTLGNLEKRYIGQTDESLCSIGRNELCGIEYPDCELIFSSGMKRCRETAEIIYPNKNIAVFKGLEECDFGDFEGKNYLELSDNIDYQNWIDSGGKSTFPNGENIAVFKKRCIAAFDKIVAKFSDCDSISLIVHSGTIMSILENYALPKRDYFDFQVKNGHGYITEFDGEKITILEQI